MIRLQDLREGDIIKVNDEGVERQGRVMDVSRDENMALVHNGVQEFWYAPEQMGALNLDEDQLMKLGFERQEADGGVKYMKGPFRVFLPEAGNFSNLEVWYREDHRVFHKPLFVHELQNHYYQMTKVILEQP